MSLRIALFGQAPVAIDCLDQLLTAGHTLTAVFAPPDGRGPDPLAARARELGLTVHQRRFFQKKGGEPIAAALDDYRELEADLNVLASFTSFLPREITDAPKHKSICFHPSLLPAYRGGHAMQWQIIEGCPEVGVSIFVPDEGVDTGPIVVQKGGVEIGPEDTTGSLFFKKLAPLGVEALIEAVEAIDQGRAKLQPQDESGASFQGLVDDTVAAIDLSEDASAIDRRARACDPQPGAALRLGDETIRLYDVRLEAGKPGKPGEIVALDDDGLVIALAGGGLRVGRVRADAGKEKARDFAKRRGIAEGTRFTSG